jgi:thiol-disulfide isomerase/thioredoxin
LLAVLAVAACGKTTGTAAHGELAKALATARNTGKVVFVDFGATWCGPCKRLASTTLADPTVDAWLREHTIALRVDIDESPALAKEFHVTSVPVMLFLRADRTELGRMTGFVDAKTFLRDAEDRLHGITSLQRAREAALAAPDDCNKQFALMRELRNVGQYDDALAAADVYWRESRTSLMQTGVRVSFFLGEMGQLADAHPPAESRMRVWIAAARDRLVRNKGVETAAQEIVAIARELHDPRAVLDTANDLIAKRGDARDALCALAVAAPKELVADRRYALVVDGGGCEPATVKEKFAMMRGAAKHAAKLMGEPSADSTRTMLHLAAEEALPAFEALAGVDRGDDALAIAKFVLANDDAELREMFVRAANRAGHPELVDDLPGKR